MAAQVFLSLSYVDADYVRAVRTRLPRGLAYFYEESFQNGELLLAAMERTVASAAVFVLFASKSALQSPWVNFEIAQARIAHIQNSRHRILIFPTAPEVSVSDLPAWLRNHWVARAGFEPSDVARYITGILLAPDVGISRGAVRVTGRGKSLDRLEQITADHIERTRRSPNVYVLPGFRGVGRRTFASYYMRQSLGADANLGFGPTLVLSPQADLMDLYRALRNEIASESELGTLRQDLAAFQDLDLESQRAEIYRLVDKFTKLGQAVTVVTANGLFEDSGTLKYWVQPLLYNFPTDAILFVISNRKLPDQVVETSDNIVQMRVEELSDKDIRALMVFAAERQGIENLSVSNEIIRAIGGHADVAKAAVRLVATRGAHILERDPRQLFDIQHTILGENISDSNLTVAQKRILNVLSWVPALGGDLLENTVVELGKVDADEFISAIESLTQACLIYQIGHAHLISPAIRQLFRRWHVTPPELLERFAGVLAREWRESEMRGEFRLDLFDSFVFMHALEGKALPNELKALLSAGTLHDVVRETYARGKESDDPEELARVVSWGSIAIDMKMSEATREEIMSNVVRAYIRLGKYQDAAKEITLMAGKGYRSVPFLRGHMLRRQENYAAAIPILEEAVREWKYNRSAVHELALALKRSGKYDRLRRLLSEHGQLVKDSAMFADFQIGVDLARGDLKAVEVGIDNLRRMPDDDGKSDIRQAQLLMRRNQNGGATDLLTKLLTEESRARFQLRSLRAVAAARDGRFDAARRDLDFIKGLPGRHNAALRLEATILAEEGALDQAQSKLDLLTTKVSEDWLLQARIWELKAERPETGLALRQKLKADANDIRGKHNFGLEYDYGED